MTKSESKYFNTAVKIDNALLTLLAKKDFQYITVKEICKTAGINRSTFYLHYETIGDLLTETVEYITGKFKEKFAHIKKLTTAEIENAPKENLVFISPKYLEPYLEFMKENRTVFHAVMSQPSVIEANKIFNKMYGAVIYPIMKRFGMSDKEIEYKNEFYIEGMFAVICKWIDNDCKDEVSYIANLICECIFPNR